MRRLLSLLGIFFLGGFCFVGPSSWAQTPPPSPSAGTPVVALVDTAIVGLELPPGAPECRSITIEPDTLGFGVPGTMVLGFDSNSFRPSAEELVFSEPWLRVSSIADATDENQIVCQILVYRLNPFRIKAKGTLGPVVFMGGTASDLNETAGIRLPRTWSLHWWFLILPALLIAVVLAALWWAWTRRRRLEPLEYWPPAEPAWLKMGIDLRNLLEADSQDHRNTRLFLDQLAGITRHYLAGRFGVNAVEMTGKEILTACGKKGHDSRPLRQLIQTLESVDRTRYNPDSPPVSWCRQQAAGIFQTMGELRIIPRYTFVDSTLLVAGEKAWAWLLEDESLVLDPVHRSQGGV